LYSICLGRSLREFYNVKQLTIMDDGLRPDQLKGTHNVPLNGMLLFIYLWMAMLRSYYQTWFTELPS